MNSFFAKLYLDLQKQIKTAAPEIKWIEQDFGQDSFDQWRPDVAFPAALIDFPQADYSQMGDAHEFGTVKIAIRLLFAPFSQSYEAAPIKVKENALEYFELEHKLIEALHNWQPDSAYCQPLVRNSVVSNNRNDIGLRIRTILFDTAYESYFE